jgi:uncharacterized membrane protein
LPYILTEWLNLAIRWFHVFAGIMWIGQTYFFTWLDRTIHAEKQVWMVHSGGFYIVDKQAKPERLTKTLHWFKWEAALTFISGMLLLTLVYYVGGIMAADSPIGLTPIKAAAFSVAIFFAAWFIYDTLWISPLAKHEVAAVTISYLLLAASIYGFTRIFGGRAAYMQAGATMGTLMAWNVWARILPAQRSLIRAVEQGREPDMTLAERAKQRSKHNTFMIVPVVLIMISNHFPVATYGNTYNWLILAALVLVGWVVAKIIRDN